MYYFTGKGFFLNNIFFMWLHQNMFLFSTFWLLYFNMHIISAEKAKILATNLVF